MNSFYFIWRLTLSLPEIPSLFLLIAEQCVWYGYCVVWIYPHGYGVHIPQFVYPVTC